MFGFGKGEPAVISAQPIVNTVFVHFKMDYLAIADLNAKKAHIEPHDSFRLVKFPRKWPFILLKR